MTTWILPGSRRTQFNGCSQPFLKQKLIPLNSFIESLVQGAQLHQALCKYELRPIFWKKYQALHLNWSHKNFLQSCVRFGALKCHVFCGFLEQWHNAPKMEPCFWKECLGSTGALLDQLIFLIYRICLYCNYHVCDVCSFFCNYPLLLSLNKRRKIHLRNVMLINWDAQYASHLLLLGTIISFVYVKFRPHNIMWMRLDR